VQNVLCWVSGFLLAAGCAGAGSQRSGIGSAAAPELSVAVLHKDGATGALRALSSHDFLGATEEPTIELRADQPSHVSVVLYAADGISEELTEKPGGAPLIPGHPLRVGVPRRAPPNVKETELHVFIVASAAPLSPHMHQLLRLPCGEPGRRGDPEPEKNKESAKKTVDSGSSRSGTGAPPEGPPRGGGGSSTCLFPPGLGAPVVVRDLLLRSR